MWKSPFSLRAPTVFSPQAKLENFKVFHIRVGRDFFAKAFHSFFSPQFNNLWRNFCRQKLLKSYCHWEERSDAPQGGFCNPTVCNDCTVYKQELILAVISRTLFCSTSLFFFSSSSTLRML